jgi:chorismate dehydratase
MTQPVRLGAVGYLNARPLVYGLEHAAEFSVRFDVPARCADLLHQGAIDLGLIPSIEYLRAPADGYTIVPDLAIASHGAVASVALYATRPIQDVRSIALDTSSRTSVALVRVLCARIFNIAPSLHPHGPELSSMLAESDAALIIGDNALVQRSGEIPLAAAAGGAAPASRAGVRSTPDPVIVEKIDLGEVWTRETGLPFVYAFWAGPAGVLTPLHVHRLQVARDAGLKASTEIATRYFPGAPALQAIGARYLRDNIQYSLGPDERSGLELFYRWAAELGVVERARELRFF